MYQPVLSIDVSKSKSCAASFVGYEEPYRKPFSFRHSQEDVNLLLKHLHDLEANTGIKPDVVLEATGNFSKPLSSFFEKSGYQVVVLNPIQTHQQKAKSIRKVKTDPIDANRIAHVYYLSKTKPTKALSELTADLRNLCRQYDGLNSLYTEVQLRLQNILDLLFPNYYDVFRNVCCKSSLKILEAYPSPQLIMTAPRNKLIEIIHSSARGHSLSLAEEKVNTLLKTAEESLPSEVAQQSNIRVLRDYIQILKTHQVIMADLRAHIIEQASLSPAYLLLQSIPGIGELTAATIIGEIGDIHNFPSTKQLVAFAGLDSAVFESGKFKSTNNRISKRGSSDLRKALYQAVVVGVTKRKNSPVNAALYEFYTKKLTEGKPTKVALVAACNKLLRIVYGVWHSNTPFKVV